MKTALRILLILICILSACWALKSLPHTLELMSGATALVDRPHYDARLNWTFRILRPIYFVLSMSLLVLAYGLARRRTWVLKFATAYLMLKTVGTIVQTLVPLLIFWPHLDLVPDGRTREQLAVGWVLLMLMYYLHPLSIWCLVLWHSKVAENDIKKKGKAGTDFNPLALNYEQMPKGEQGNASH